jgi:Bacteriophage capsid portal protein
MTEFQPPKTNAYVIERSLKADTQMVVSSVPLQVEDVYVDMYYTASNTSGRLIMPPFNPIALKNMVRRNNILQQCVEAMEINIAGTGWEVRQKPESGTEDKKEYQRLKDFFTEPFPGMSWTTLRRKIRNDLESTGNAYIEVLRTGTGEVAFLRRLDAILMRMVRLDAPVPVEKTVMRDGKEVTLTLMVRERKFAQMVGMKLQYYKEYGCSRRVNRKTGEWVEEGQKLSADEVGTEIIHLTVTEDTETPYGLPRWINNTPSVLGSRKAEEFNLGYFDAGGLPPAVVFLKGGSMAADVADTLRGYLSGKISDKQRAVIIETYSNAGSLDSNTRVDVSVERFGWESTQDAMFQNYDKAAEEHVRAAFRLPPLFIGKSHDLNFASAYASYLVAEAQIFAPERQEEDELINNLLRREFGAKNYELRALPLNVKDVAIQLKAIDLIRDRIDPENMVNTVNDVVGLDLEYDEETYDFNKTIMNKRRAATYSDSATDYDAAVSASAKSEDA